MAFCPKCGQQVDDGNSFCTKCGAPLSGGAPAQGEVRPTADSVAKDREENKGFAVCAYIWLLWLVPFLAAPKSKFARFHANQGLVLFIIETALAIISTIFSFIPFLGWILNILTGLCGVFCLVCAILGIVNAASGKEEPLPIIGSIKIL